VFVKILSILIVDGEGQKRKNMYAVVFLKYIYKLNQKPKEWTFAYSLWCVLVNKLDCFYADFCGKLQTLQERGRDSLLHK